MLNHNVVNIYEAICQNTFGVSLCAERFQKQFYVIESFISVDFDLLDGERQSLLSDVKLWYSHQVSRSHC